MINNSKPKDAVFSAILASPAASPLVRARRLSPHRVNNERLNREAVYITPKHEEFHLVSTLRLIYY